MGEDYLKKLVNRYLEKKSTDEELEIFVNLMKQGKLDQYIQEAMNEDVDAHLQAEPDIKRKSLFARLRWPVAATIALALGALTYVSISKLPSGITAKTIKINNLTSTIHKQVLPDGSTVWLNPNTHLSYPSRFGKLREVSMRGEAFFEVTKDHAHPFVITSGTVLTKVWGTSFRIRSIPGERDTKVSVLTGKVSVSIPGQKTAVTSLKQHDKEEVLLLPQQEATYQQANHHLIKAPIPVSSDVIVWRKANLSFEDTPLVQIAAELSKYYHVQIKAEGDTLNQTQLTADFNGKNLADILVLICKSLHTSYNKEDNTIILRTANQKPISIN
jgi:transmembrane sensor